MLPTRLYGARSRVIVTALFLFAIFITCFASHVNAAGRVHHHQHACRVFCRTRHAQHHQHASFEGFLRELAAARPMIASAARNTISVGGHEVERPGAGAGLFSDASTGLDLGLNSTRKAATSLASMARETAARVARAARARGMNVSMAVHVCMTEGCKSYVGDGGTSFGPFQLHYTTRGHRPALGNLFTAQTGLDARDPRTMSKQIDWALDYAQLHGWRHDWFGWQQIAWRWRHHRHHGHYASVDGDTAIYDIAARTVTLPDGRRLEAHSGLGPALDNPRDVAERRRGPTPPGIYALAPRGWFHGVYALGLTPIVGNAYGRSGILAHSCMLGGRCESFGCVSFRDYRAFLAAYRSGAVRRIEVVAGSI